MFTPLLAKGVSSSSGTTGVFDGAGVFDGVLVGGKGVGVDVFVGVFVGTAVDVGGTVTGGAVTARVGMAGPLSHALSKKLSKRRISAGQRGFRLVIDTAHDCLSIQIIH